MAVDRSQASNISLRSCIASEHPVLLVMIFGTDPMDDLRAKVTLVTELETVVHSDYNQRDVGGTRQGIMLAVKLLTVLVC